MNHRGSHVKHEKASQPEHEENGEQDDKNWRVSHRVGSFFSLTTIVPAIQQAVAACRIPPLLIQFNQAFVLPVMTMVLRKDFDQPSRQFFDFLGCLYAVL